MNILKLRPLFLIISSILIITSIVSVIFWGFRSSIDFIGGATWEINLPTKPDNSKIEEIFNNNGISNLSISANDSQYNLSFQDITSDQKSTLDQEIIALDPDFIELKFESLGPSLGKELLQKTIIAIILSCVTILLFITYRFKDFHFGLAAILALIHDGIVMIGGFSVLGHFFGAEFNSLFVTALLTILSLSVYDTVVIFDRLRDLRFKNFKSDWESVANEAVVSSLTRSINTSATTVFTLAALAILGGETTRWFAVALLIGIISGTYSSIGVAVPLVLFFKKHSKKSK